ncbi:hypothetical protein BH10PSE1_BH10PSE1_18210 [soil metagenome]
MIQLAAPSSRTPPILRVGQVFGVVLAAFILFQNAAYFRLANGQPSPSYGSIGLSSFFHCATDHFCTVTKASPYTPDPAAQAGIRPGDAVRFDHRIDTVRSKAVGEHVGLTVRSGGAERHVVLMSVARPGMWAPTYMTSAVIYGLVALVGGFVVLRGWRRPAVLLVGLAYICSATAGGYPRFWQNAPELYAAFFILLNLSLNAVPVLFLAAVRLFRREATGRDPRWLRSLVWLYGGFQFVALATACWTAMNATSLPFMPDSITLSSIAGAVGAALTLVALASGLPSVEPGQRTRYRFMVAALGVTSLVFLVDPVIMLTGNDYVTASAPVVIQLAAALIGVILFAYATLRHRVVDLGFAINRTLVYGVLSTVLLFAFWFCEWGLEEIIPAETREANILISAGIAFAIFLTFHHIRDWVEKAIEHLFFRAWREKDAALARFLKQAAFVTRADALRAASVTAFSEYADDAEVTLYVAEPSGYMRQDGAFAGAPDRFDLDEPAMVRLRAEREAFDDALPAGAGLILPMLHRSEITGFFLFGKRAAGEVFRPDERKLLAEGALKIGLDLHALRVEALEAENRQQRQRADTLEQQLHRKLKGATCEPDQIVRAGA